VPTTFDHWLITLAGAPTDLGGSSLLAAIVVARWALFLGPALLAALWLGPDAEDRRVAVAAALSGGAALVAAASLSAIVFEPRPFMDGPARNYLDHVRDSGFPSDHATLLFALAFSLRLRPPPRLPRIWIAVLVLAAAVGWARVFLGTHYPVDIAGAALVAATAALLVARPWGRTATERVAQLCETSSERLLAMVRLRKTG